MTVQAFRSLLTSIAFLDETCYLEHQRVLLDHASSLYVVALLEIIV